MSALSRIPGMAPLVSAVATTFALHANPTLRQYNDALAQRFYHHGRLCASNQATVMVLVILFVGMISYPGIVTSYNSSAYARQRNTFPSSVSLSFPYQKNNNNNNSYVHSGAHSTRNNPTQRTVGDLNAFWLQKVVAPTWTQDPDEFNSRLPSTEPLHFLAPLVINASNLFHDGIGNDSAAGDLALTGLDLFVYASRIQERIQSIVVEYNGKAQGTDMRVSSPSQEGVSRSRESSFRMVSLQDICLQKPPPPSIPNDELNQRKATRSCLVHSPVLNQNSSITDDLTVESDKTWNGFNSSQDSLTSLFSGVILEHSHENQPNSLVMTFFLRGDLENERSQTPRVKGAEKSTFDSERINVRHVWTLIIDRLMRDLADERTGAISRWSQLEGDLDSPLIEAGSVERINVELHPSHSSSQSNDLSIPPHLTFQAQLFSISQSSGSKRLVSEVKIRSCD